MTKTVDEGNRDKKDAIASCSPNVDTQKRHVADTYLEVSKKLSVVYSEACGALNNEQLMEIKWKIDAATYNHGLAGPEYKPISDAVRALELAWGVKKIAGGAGDRAYKKSQP